MTSLYTAPYVFFPASAQPKIVKIDFSLEFNTGPVISVISVNPKAGSNMSLMLTAIFFQFYLWT